MIIVITVITREISDHERPGAPLRGPTSSPALAPPATLRPHKRATPPHWLRPLQPTLLWGSGLQQTLVRGTTAEGNPGLCVSRAKQQPGEDGGTVVTPLTDGRQLALRQGPHRPTPKPCSHLDPTNARHHQDSLAEQVVQPTSQSGRLRPGLGDATAPGQIIPEAKDEDPALPRSKAWVSPPTRF